MKRILLGFATISLFTLFCSGCDSNSMAATPPSANASSITPAQQANTVLSADCETAESFEYQISVNGCDTGDRIYFDRADLCSGLQLAENNNDCPASDREDYFHQQCKGYTWNPDSEGNTATGHTPTRGLNLTCSFSLKIDPTDNDLILNSSLLKRQSTSAISLVIHQPGYYMNANQAANADGTYSLTISITDEAGNVMSRGSDSVTAGKELDLKIESKEKNLQAICQGIEVKS